MMVMPHLHGDDKAVDDFVNDIESRYYPSADALIGSGMNRKWAKPQRRELRIFDLTIPETMKDDVLNELIPYEKINNIEKLRKLMDTPILADIAYRAVGLEKVDRSKYPEADKFVQVKHPVRLCIIGVLPDNHRMYGSQLLEEI